MGVAELLKWPSLAPQLALETVLFGTSSPHLGNWLNLQIQFLDDPEFAKLFSDNIDCFDVAPSSYNHRLIETKHGALLGGIRFYGLDVKRPFVEVVAHSFAHFDKLREAVRDEWAMFAPQFVRLTVAAGNLPTKDSILDVSIHAARYCEMVQPSSEIELIDHVDMQLIERLVADRYEEVVHTQPELAKNISAMDMETLGDCHANGDLFGARFPENDQLIGMVAVKENAIGWIAGDVVQEEVVAAAHAGKGIATQMQCALARMRAAEMPDQLMLGTIDRHNHASRKSAERAGRPEVLRRVFLPL